MSHTEQMREALHKIKHEAVSLADAQVIALEALTAPAAEVPEAMGDAEIDAIVKASNLGGGGPFWPDNTGEFVRAIIAARDAQWQSTRLRGGVPEGWKPVPVEPTTEMVNAFFSELSGACGSFFDEDDAPSGGFPKAWQNAITAAPQAPAPALDAGVVRDAVLAEREACLELVDDCARAHMHASVAAKAIRARGDAAMSDQAGKGGAA